MILQHNLDMIDLCKTWLEPKGFLPLNEASAPDYTNAHVAWATKQGEGLTSKLDITFSSFEALVLNLSPSAMNCFVQNNHSTVWYS